MGDNTFVCRMGSVDIQSKFHLESYATDKYLTFQSYPDCMKQLDAEVPRDEMHIECILYTKLCLMGLAKNPSRFKN